MRFLLLAAAALLPQASAAASGEADGPPVAQSVAKPEATKSGECRKVTSYKAESDLVWRDQRVAPKQLTELPPGTGYMAAYRTINGCEAPMTVVEYRNSAGR